MTTGELTILEGIKSNLDQVFLISPQESRILGRSTMCHFRISDPLVSSLHCQFDCQEPQVVVRDLLSANGIFVNDELVDSTVLNLGDRIRAGKTVLQFSEFKGDVEGKEYSRPEKQDLSLGEDEEEEKAPLTAKVPLGRMIKKSKDLIICRLAIKNHLLEHEQIRHILAMQRQEIRKKNDCDLTSLLISEQLLKPKVIDTLLREHKYYKLRNKDIQFGKAVVEQKLVDEERVQECLQVQERRFQETKEVQRLGEILVQKGHLTVQENNRLIKALAKKRREEEEI